MEAIITLTSDFGLADSYVAAVKGVVLTINPEAKLVDICHSIRPQDIAQAAFVLSTACQFFPRRTIHVVVVDPGVGTERRAIILRTPSADFVAPDNGVLSYVIQPFLDRPADYANIKPIELPTGLEAVSITRPEFWRSPVSPTFHGRDIFAPVAARLSLGCQPIEFGEAITSVNMMPLPRPQQTADSSLTGRILHIDGFGNLVTNIAAADLSQPEQTLLVEVRGHTIAGLSRTYAEGKELLALISSSGYLEIALTGGSAAAFLEAEVGDEIRVSLP